MKLNPNHEVVKAVDAHWHKLAALIMFKLGVPEVVITTQDIDAMVNANAAFITIQELSDGLHLKMGDEVTAHKLAREHGGLPH